MQKVQLKCIETYLWEFVAYFFNLLPLLANDGSMKTLFNDQVLCALVLLYDTASLMMAPGAKS